MGLLLSFALSMNSPVLGEEDRHNVVIYSSNVVVTHRHINANQFKPMNHGGDMMHSTGIQLYQRRPVRPRRNKQHVKIESKINIETRRSTTLKQRVILVQGPC